MFENGFIRHAGISIPINDYEDNNLWYEQKVSSKQLNALTAITDIKTYGLKISKGKADILIRKFNKGENIKNEVIKLVNAQVYNYKFH